MDTIDLSSFNPVTDKNGLFSNNVSSSGFFCHSIQHGRYELSTQNYPCVRFLFPRTKFANENGITEIPDSSKFEKLKETLEENCLDYLKKEVFGCSVWKSIPSLRMLSLHALNADDSQLSPAKTPFRDNKLSLFGFMKTSNRVLGVDRPRNSMKWNIAEKILDNTTYPWILGPKFSCPLYFKKMNQKRCSVRSPKHPLTFYTLLPFQDFEMYVTVIFKEISDVIEKIQSPLVFFKCYFSTFSGNDPEIGVISVVKYCKEKLTQQTMVCFVFLIDQLKPIKGHNFKFHCKSKTLPYSSLSFSFARGRRHKLTDFFSNDDSKVFFSLNDPGNMACVQNPISLAQRISKNFAWDEFQFLGFRLPLSRGKWFVVNFSQAPWHPWGPRKLEKVQKFLTRLPGPPYYLDDLIWQKLREVLGITVMRKILKHYYQYYCPGHQLQNYEGIVENNLLLLLFFQKLLSATDRLPDYRLGLSCIKYLERKFDEQNHSLQLTRL